MLSNKNMDYQAIFASFNVSGTEDATRFFIRNTTKLAVITLFFHHITNAPLSRLRLYEKGEKKRDLELFTCIPPKKLIFLLLPLIYLVHLYDIIWAVLSLEKKTNKFYIGVNYFCVFVGLLLKKIGLVHIVVYWAYDYFPIPKSGIYRILVRIFVIIDKFCINHSDVVWHLSPKMLEKRIEDNIIENMEIPQMIVPLGIDDKQIKYSTFNDVDLNTIGFVGVLKETQGLELVLDIIPDIVKKVPSFNFKIIGSGPHEAKLKEYVQKNNLGKHVTFYGYVEDQNEVYHILSKCAIAVAPYVPDIYNFTQYTDPAKVKLYLSYGVPVVITNVPYIAQDIDKAKAGIATKFNREEILNAILKLLTDKQLLKEYKNNAFSLAKEFNQDLILSKAITDTFIAINLSKKNRH